MKLYKVSMENLVTFLLTALCFFCQTSYGEDYSSCGLRSVHRGKIFGGLPSRPGMWPWQVAIFRKIRDVGQRPKFICGGALINSRWVISAAHCFHKRPHEKYVDYSYTVKAGEYKIDMKDPHEQERNAFGIHNHPNFVPNTFENDIALIELDKGVKMGPHIRSICLPKANEILTTSGHVVSVAGWGFTRKGSLPSVLLYSAFEIQTNRKCADTTRYLYNETVMFCAGQSKGGNDTCKGDSGGSSVRQVLRDGRRRWVTVGLVSWGEECGIKGKYGYYTRVEPFVPWIQDKINGSSLSCGDPGSIRNGRIIGSEFLVGFTVKYICNEGYQMRGRPRRRCRRNGKWTSKAPTCVKVECRNPGTPRYGVRRPRRNKYYFKDKVRFRCKTNYTIIGRSVMRCQSDGTWSGFKPVCLVPCKDPGIPAGGVRLDHSFKHGQTVRFLCRKRNQPSSVSFLTCNNGKWNQNIPRCNGDCDDPGTPTNGQRQGEDFTLNKRVYFTCDRGYIRVGPAYLQCQSNRRWSDKAPICQHLSCIRPKLPENAFIYGRGQLKEKYGFDEVVMFQCKRGYSASGSPFVRCLAVGWTKTNLRCSPKNCGDPGHPTNGRREGDVFTFKSQVNFTCDRTGYELKGSVQRLCQENGRWSGTRTTCEPVECRDPGLVNGGRYPDKDKYVFKDSIQFLCKTNYTMIGDRSITCQHDKLWSGNVPRCLAPCRDPGIPNNGQRLDHSFLHNARVKFSCQRGWNIDGAQTIRCHNGNWNHPTPQCLGCGSALGMESRKIPDGNIQAPSTRWGYHAKDGRLNGPYAWCSGTGRDPYLQIDLGTPYKITGLATQGSAYDNRWVEWYAVSSILAGSLFNMYREDNRDKIFIGNRDTRSIVRNKLKNPVIARRLRIHPQGGFSSLSPACMRVEIYGCDLPSDCILVGSRIVAKWSSNLHGGYKYFKAYLTRIRFRYWKVKLENENHGRPAEKFVQKFVDLPFVLDVPPKHEELQVGTRVLTPWGHIYYTSTIKTGRDRYNRYRVKADDGDELVFTIDKIRLLKAPTFCN